MHDTAYAFVKQALAGRSMAGQRVLEIGSYNVNGGVRDLFSGCATYLGVDLRYGPGVDLVADARCLDIPGGSFDIAVCCEVLEHTPEPWAIIAEAQRLLVSGGLLIVTAAGPSRPRHSCNGRPQVPPDEHYRNIIPADLEDWRADWVKWRVSELPERSDIYLLAVKP